MIKPNMPNVPGMEAMTDSLDFVKNLWSSMGVPGMNMPGMNVPGMNIPGMVMPTLSVEEINKKITDLKAVEAWLTLNMNMLRGTIQGLEVQAATISTLQQMGETFTATMSSAGAPSATASQASASAYSGNGGAAGNGTQQAQQPHPTPEPTKKDEQDAASLTAPLVNAAAWWNVLQDQFQQAVSSAMATEPPVAASSAKPKAKAKPRTKTASATTTTARKRKPAK